jgi:hypothetical protein
MMPIMLDIKTGFSESEVHFYMTPAVKANYKRRDRQRCSCS